MIYLKYFAPVSCAGLIDAWLVHAQCDAIEENNSHTDSFKPRVYSSVKGKYFFFF